MVRERQLTKVEHQSDWKAWQARLKNVATGLSLLKARVESAPGQGMGAVCACTRSCVEDKRY